MVLRMMKLLYLKKTKIDKGVISEQDAVENEDEDDGCYMLLRYFNKMLYRYVQTF